MEDYKPRAARAEPDASLIQLDEDDRSANIVPLKQSSDKPSTGACLLEATRKVGCCLCSPLTCAIRYIVYSILFALVVVGILIALIVLAAGQTKKGADTISDAANTVFTKVMGAYLLPVQDDQTGIGLYRHWFSMQLPLPKLFMTTIQPGVHHWGGWIELRPPTSFRFNVTNAGLTDTGGSDPVVYAITAWTPMVATAYTQVYKIADLSASSQYVAGSLTPCPDEWCRTLLDRWLGEPDVNVIVLLLQPSASAPWPTTLDQVAPRLLAAARVD